LRDVVAFADQRQTMGDRQQFAARLDRPASKRSVKIRRTAGTKEVPPVRKTLSMAVAAVFGLLQNIVERALDPRQVVGNPAVEVSATHRAMAGAPQRSEVEGSFIGRESAILVAETAW
jgi:hypothetical protein